MLLRLFFACPPEQARVKHQGFSAGPAAGFIPDRRNHADIPGVPQFQQGQVERFAFLEGPLFPQCVLGHTDAHRALPPPHQVRQRLIRLRAQLPVPAHQPQLVGLEPLGEFYGAPHRLFAHGGHVICQKRQQARNAQRVPAELPAPALAHLDVPAVFDTMGI